MEESIPIKLDQLTFTIFSRYLSTFKKKVKKKSRRGEVVRDGDVDEVEVRLSASSYESACSALSHLYTDAGLNKEAISPELWKKLSSYKKGSRRMGASEKNDFGLKLSEGKRPLSYQAKISASRRFYSEVRKRNILPLMHSWFLNGT
jgi:hypothetical protein